MKWARIIEEEVVLRHDGTRVEGVIVVRKWDSVEMADGSELPELQAEHIPDVPAAPGRKRWKLTVPEVQPEPSKRRGR